MASPGSTLLLLLANPGGPGGNHGGNTSGGATSGGALQYLGPFGWLLPFSGVGQAPAVPGTFREALRAALDPDPTLATLFGGGIFFATAPAGKAYPYATYSEPVGQARVNTSPGFYEDLDCRFDFFDSDDLRAEAFGSALLARLKAVGGTVRFSDGYLANWRLLGQRTDQVDRALTPHSFAWRRLVMIRFVIGRVPS